MGDPDQGTRPLCINGFPSVEQAVRDLDFKVIEADFKFNSTILIPDMEFTCGGTIAKVTVAGMILDYDDRELDMNLKLQIWRNQSETLHKVYEIEIELSSDSMKLCEFEMQTPKKILPCVHIFTLMEQNMSVESGDILGIELPPGPTANFKLYSVEKCRVTTYTFVPIDIPSTNLELLNGSRRNTA